jgi:hypothetical protein
MEQAKVAARRAQIAPRIRFFIFVFIISIL